ncbi:MAG: hypothetical protein H6528_02340 [Actinobacteria bacterium]|nr:hypothetical protein [Actinomycetota bacterium]MCB8996124.1 hypothetical protein [Actinomycetota bacterium]HRY10118.1 hypothetical protein [Candidatus Nanopelagicales bacterium]
MSFEDLPKGWQELPLDDDKLIHDVLDLFVSMRDRYDGTLFVLLCDEDRRVVQPIVVEEVERLPPPDSDIMLGNLVTAIRGVREDLCALVAIARPGPLRVFGFDEQWAGFIERAFTDRVPLLGIHLVTPSGSVSLRPQPMVA